MMHLADRTSWRERIFAALLALLAVTALFVRSDLLEPGHPDFELPRDHHKYIHMAEGDILDFHLAPFCWRVGVPLLVKVLPFSTRMGFLTIALVSLWATGILLYFSARRFGFSPRLSATGTLLFYSLGWAAKFNLIHFWLSDAATLAMVGALILLVQQRRMVLVVLVLALGVLVKESLIFAAPLLYTLRARRLWDAPLLAQSILCTLPAVALLVLLRMIIPAGNSDVAYLATLPEQLSVVHSGVANFDLGYLWREFGLQRLTAPTLLNLKEMSIWSWGPLVLLIPFFVLRRPREIFIRFTPFLLLAYAQLLLASNSQRLVVLASAAVILPGLAVLREWGTWLRAGESCWMILAAGLVALNLLNPVTAAAPFPIQLTYFLMFVVTLGIGRRFRAFDPERGTC
jgi:hypothetical protein